MLTLPDIRAIVAQIEYRKCESDGHMVSSGWIHGVMGNGFYIQFQQCLVDCEFLHRPAAWQKGRKWYISPHMTRSELVQTCLMAILAFEEHEAREAFFFEGERVFGPHININALADAANNREKRDESTVDRSVTGS